MLRVEGDKFLMKATGVEYRSRLAIQAAIYGFGFMAVPAAVWVSPQLKDVVGFTDKSSWLVLASALARSGWFAFNAATIVLLVVALVLTGLGAWLRVWGSAYGASEGPRVDGPYRRTRNPLHLGTLLHTVGIAILMTPGGAVVAVVLMWVFEVRLALAEEAIAAGRCGGAYAAYEAAVPRFLPSPAAQVAAGGARPRWGLAVLGEIYFVAAFGVLAVLGWGFNAQPLWQGLMISAGVAMVVRALLPGKRVVSGEPSSRRA